VFRGGGDEKKKDVRDDISVSEMVIAIMSYRKELKKKKEKMNNKNTELVQPTMLFLLPAETLSVLGLWKDSLRDTACRHWRDCNLDCGSIVAQGGVTESVVREDLGQLLDHLGLESTTDPSVGEIVFAVRSGLHMYGLNMSTCEEGYFLCFRSRTKAALRSDPPQTQFERRVHEPMSVSNAGDFEYTGKEIGQVLIELSKGNPNYIEFLFLESGRAIHESGAWARLRSIRRSFLTMSCVSQYIKFVSKRLEIIEKLLPVCKKEGVEGSENDCPPRKVQTLDEETEDAVAKHFCLAFQKLYNLRRVVRYEDPVVVCRTGTEEHSDIMSILRSRPLDPQNLLGRARSMLQIIIFDIGPNDKQRLKEGLEARRRCVCLKEIYSFLRDIRISNIEPDGEEKREIENGINGENATGKYKAIGNKSKKAHTVQPPPLHSPHANGSKILQRLREIELELGVKIVFAAEFSSRSLETFHEHSDHSILSLFVHRRERYHSMRSFPTKFRKKFPAALGCPEIDITGLECRHAFKIFSRANLTMLELFLSPVVYCRVEVAGLDWVDAVRALSRSHVDPSVMACSALSRAKEDVNEYFFRKEKGMLTEMRHLQVIRRVLLAQWLIIHKANSKDHWPPPVTILEQLQSGENKEMPIPESVRSVLKVMLSVKDKCLLSDQRPNLEVLDTFIADCLEGFHEEQQNSHIKQNTYLKGKINGKENENILNVSHSIKHPGSLIAALNTINCALIGEASNF